MTEELKIFSDDRSLKSCFLIFWTSSLRLLHVLRTPLGARLGENGPLWWLAVGAVCGHWRRGGGREEPIGPSVLLPTACLWGLCVPVAGPHNEAV